MKTIPLTQGKVAFVDDEDFERLNAFKWCAWKSRNTFYAKRVDRGRKTVYMHREVSGVRPGVKTDHRNGNGLDNQKENIRSASPQQNAINSRKRASASSQFKGVSWCSTRKLWRANLQRKHLGYFHSEFQAAFAYDIEAIKIFGEFARPNFNQQTRK